MTLYSVGLILLLGLLFPGASISNDELRTGDSRVSIEQERWTIQQSGTTANLTSVVFVD